MEINMKHIKLKFEKKLKQLNFTICNYDEKI